MGWALIRSYDARGKRFGLTHVLYENASSVLWHHLFGFSWLQLFNYIQIGDRIWWKVPFATCPAVRSALTRWAPLVARPAGSVRRLAPPFRRHGHPRPDPIAAPARQDLTHLPGMLVR